MKMFVDHLLDPEFRSRVDDIRWILELCAELDDPVPLSWVATELGVSLDIAATWCALVSGEVGEPIRFRFSWTSAPPSPVPSGTSSAVRSMRDQVVRGGCSGLQCVHRRESGDLIIVGALAGVAAYDASSGYPVEVTLGGVWELSKTSGQINEGAAVRFDNTTGHNVVNASSAGMFPIGVAVRAAGTNDTTCRVRLSGIPVTAVPGGGG